MLAQNTHIRRREQLMCRTNSLKKAIQQIIEYTEKRKISFCFFLKFLSTVNNN